LNIFGIVSRYVEVRFLRVPLFLHELHVQGGEDKASDDSNRIICKNFAEADSGAGGERQIAEPTSLLAFGCQEQGRGRIPTFRQELKRPLPLVGVVVKAVVPDEYVVAFSDGHVSESLRARRHSWQKSLSCNWVNPEDFVEQSSEELHVLESVNVKRRVQVNFSIGRLLLLKVRLNDVFLDLIEHHLVVGLVLDQGVNPVASCVQRGLSCCNEEVDDLVDDVLFVLFLPVVVVSKQVRQKVGVSFDLRLVLPGHSVADVIENKVPNGLAVSVSDSLLMVQGDFGKFVGIRSQRMLSFEEQFSDKFTERVTDLHVFEGSIVHLDAHGGVFQLLTKEDFDDVARKDRFDLLLEVKGERAVAFSSHRSHPAEPLKGLLPHGVSHRHKLFFVKAMRADFSLDLDFLTVRCCHEGIAEQTGRRVSDLDVSVDSVLLGGEHLSYGFRILDQNKASEEELHVNVGVVRLVGELFLDDVREAHGSLFPLPCFIKIYALVIGACDEVEARGPDEPLLGIELVADVVLDDWNHNPEDDCCN